MKENDKIRGLVYSRFRTKQDLAKVLGWSHQRLSKALANPQKQSLENIQAIIKALGLEVNPESVYFFMPDPTTKSSSN